ncbi:hypothetical protein [Streptomyces erythrochromogenes]|uniref:hypothetical protein n=1 Tax=Streptomyces erythrochromogenes TaxID=285574 RepID=UPI0033E935C7
MQFTGTAQVVEVATEELELFGPGPQFVNGEVFDPVRMRIEPQFITVHSLAGNGNPDRLCGHAL